MPVDEELLAQLHIVIAHLGDPPYLENLPLASQLSSLMGSSGLSRGQTVRRALYLAIASLAPGHEARSGDLEARSYQALYRYAIGRESIEAISRQLGVGKRQGYRELRRGMEALTRIVGELIADSLESASLRASPAPRTDQVRNELERLKQVTDQEVDIVRLVHDAVRKVRPLAGQYGQEIRLTSSVEHLDVAANRVMLSQAILNLLSYVVATNQERHVGVELQSSGNDVVISCFCRPRLRSNMLDPQNPYAVARELSKTLGIVWREKEGDNRIQCIRLTIPLAKKHGILIVDDNQGIIALFTSYLRRHPYRVVGATSVADALQVLTTLQPEVIILDIMMPDRDGWDILEYLRQGRGADRPRVIVCSVVNDPQLATALGADAFLSKPVGRGQLLQTLEQVLSPSLT